MSDGSFGLEIGEQGKVQLAVFGEGAVAPCAIDRNAEQAGFEAMKLRQNLVVQRHLISAHGTPVGRIEREDDGAPRKSVKVTNWSGVLRSLKSGRRGASR